jgi:gliding motility-associated-like protein
VSGTLTGIQNGYAFAVPTTTTTYGVTEVRRTSSPSCPVTVSDEEEIVVHQNPSMNSISEDAIICEGSNYNMTISVSPATTQVSWMYSEDGNSFTSGESGTGFNTKDPGYYYATLDNFGCTATSDQVYIQTVNVSIEATASPDRMVIGEATQISATGDDDYTYEWHDYTTGELFSGPVHTRYPEETTTYNVIAHSKLNNSCFDEKDVTVEVFQTVTIPNGFSPNGDNKNEHWYVKGLELYPDTKILVFNRWGSVVYENEGYYDKPWDGTNAKGEDLPDATYYYIITLNDDEKQEFNGSITIIR